MCQLFTFSGPCTVEREMRCLVLCKFMNINDFKENRGGVGIMDQIT